MKLGIAGLLPGSIAEIDAAAFRRARELGFTGVALTFKEKPADISTERASEIGRIAAGEGIDVVEYGRYQTTLIDDDENVRAANVAELKDSCRVAKALGCPAVITGTGSFNPAGQWFPHPRNHDPATIDRLAESLRVAVRAAEEAGTGLALECHVTTVLKDAKTARDLIDAVGSISLTVHLDPVNWLTFETVYNNGSGDRGDVFLARADAHLRRAQQGHSRRERADHASQRNAYGR